jgi:hypothetical protein
VTTLAAHRNFAEDDKKHLPSTASCLAKAQIPTSAGVWPREKLAVVLTLGAPTHPPCIGGAEQYNGGAGGLGDPVDIYGNALPTIDHITNPPVLEATEEARTVLHSRAEAWYASIVPTPDEHTMRLKVVAELRAVVTAEWQGQAQLQVFGSSATGLLLKGGGRFPRPVSQLHASMWNRWALAF